jgi:sulfotransferase family protein
MSADFRLLMIGAMYENGGNTTHRFLDGHPQLFVYPFESQPGTRFVNDELTSMFPVKYRWPTFPLHASPEQDYRAIIDEEAKVRARTPSVSKFRDWPFELDDDDRMGRYCELIAHTGRTRANNIAAFFRATFDAWKNLNRSGDEEAYVGYSPIIGVDADKILVDLPAAHVLHVVRNPWSAYADTRKRAVPLSLHHYMLGWVINQHLVLLHRRRFPGRVHVVRAEDVMADSRGTLGAVLGPVGLDSEAASLSRPSWNGKALDQVYPWGTIRTPTPEANRATADELDEGEKAAVQAAAGPYLALLGYAGFLAGNLEPLELPSV